MIRSSQTGPTISPNCHGSALLDKSLVTGACRGPNHGVHRDHASKTTGMAKTTHNVLALVSNAILLAFDHSNCEILDNPRTD